MTTKQKKPSKKATPKPNPNVPHGGHLTAPLTKVEAKRLVCLQAIIEEGLGTFNAVGLALKEIRDSRLYRQDYTTFESYLNEEWGIGRSHGARLIEASETVALIEGAGLPTPQTERSTRALTGLSDEEKTEAYAEAVEESGGEPPSVAQVEKAAKNTRDTRSTEGRKTDEFGFSEDELAKDPKLATAMKNIGRILGANVEKAIVIGSIEMKKAEAIVLGAMTAEQMKEMEPLIVGLHWSVSRAAKFLAAAPDEKTTVEQLINYCISAGGKYDATINGFDISISRRK